MINLDEFYPIWKFLFNFSIEALRALKTLGFFGFAKMEERCLTCQETSAYPKVLPNEQINYIKTIQVVGNHPLDNKSCVRESGCGERVNKEGFWRTEKRPSRH